MKQYKITKLVPEVIRVRRAEPEMVLMAPVHNEVGQLLMKEGRELDERDLRRLKKYGVKKITVETEEPRWFSDQDLDESPDDSDVLETREIEPVREERVRDVEESDSLDELFEQVQWLDYRDRQEGGALDLLGNLREIVDLQESVQSLRTNLEDHPQNDNARDLLEALEGECKLESVLDIRDMPDSLLTDVFEVLARRDNLKDDLVERLGEAPLPPDTPETLPEPGDGTDGEIPDLEDWIEGDQLEYALLEVLEDLKSREDVDETLLEELRRLLLELDRESETREEYVRQTHQEVYDDRLKRHLLNALDGIGDLEDPPPADHEEEIEHQTELIEQITAFNQGRRDRRGTLESLFQQLRDEELLDVLPDRIPEATGLGPDYPRRDEEGPTVDREERLESTLADIEQERQEGGIETVHARTDQDEAGLELFRNLLEQGESLDQEVRTTLEFCKNQFEQLRKQRRSIEGRIEMAEEDEARAEKLRDLLEHQPGDGEVLEEGDESELLNRIYDYLERKQDYARQTRETLDGLRESLAQSENLDELDEFYARVEGEIDSIRGEPGTQSENSQAGPSPPRSQREEFIRTENYSGLARRTDLSVSIVRQALDFYRIPDLLDDGVRARLKKAQDVVFDILFHARFQPEKMDNLTTQLRQDVRNESRPIKGIAQPANPAEFGLVHAYNCLYMTIWILESTGLDRERVQTLALTALVQDLGTVVLPMKKLLGQPNLSNQAQEAIKKHPIYTRKLLKRTHNVDSEVVTLAVQHHERTGGKGYPGGLEREEQHPGASLLQVVDVYTALLEDRPDRDPTPPDQAVDVLRDEDLDPRWVQALEKNVGHYPTGGYVVLSDGTLGMVRDQNEEHPESPHVLVVSDKNRHRLDSPRAVDLSQNSHSINRLVKW